MFAPPVLRPFVFRSVLAAILLAGLVPAQMRPARPRDAALRKGPAPAPQALQASAAATAPFRTLDNVEGPYVSFNTVPVRPMLLTADGGHVYAVNTHGSTVCHFNNTSGTPAQVFAVPAGPVSIARWQSSAGGGADELLVVCQVSHQLARLDRLSGQIMRLLELPFEPADILVDSLSNHAFVSCPGVDQVVEIDLVAHSIFRSYAIPGEHPLFLSFDGQSRVLVAPQFSGNDSITVASPPGSVVSSLLGILDLDTHPLVTQRLPDEDLFRIDPALNAVVALSKGAGTVLFAQGLNPVTGLHWQLNTEAVNKDPALQSEPALRGIFVKNRITITDLAQYAGSPIALHSVIDLDDTNASTSATDYDPLGQAVCGQPYQLTFVTGGYALVVGLLSNNITICDPQGHPIFRWKLAPGSIPRQVLSDPSGQFAFVYGWGTNRIDAWQVTPTPHVAFSLDLGLDPAPQIVKDGRRVFYDGDNSLHRNLSCATCHVEGANDMTLWNLSNLPYDDKGPLVTQTLKGIEKLQPLHWRGERAGLIDFNPAFDKLLGGQELSTAPGGTFDQFSAFVFGMQNPANPSEDRRRVVSVAAGIPTPPSFPAPDAITGQDQYFDGDQDGQACNFCHTLPTGTDNDTIFDSAVDLIPHRTFLKITPFNELWRKEQIEHDVSFTLGTTTLLLDYPTTGSGLTHAGLSDTLFDFVNENFGIDDQETANIVSFVSQVDQGVAPAAHVAVQLNQATWLANRSEVSDFLLPQALQRNIDLAVFGSFTLGGAVQLRWSWQRATGLFRAEDPAVPPKNLDFFLGQARTGQGDMVFVGLPVGTGDVFGIDRDDDGLLNKQEPALGCNPEKRDTDGDGFSDGYELANGSNPTLASSLPVDTTPPAVTNLRRTWITSKVARLFWDTSEQTTFRIQYSTAGDPPLSVGSKELRKVNTALLTMMKPSSGPGLKNVYTGSLTVFDERGNATSVPLPSGIETLDGIFAADAQGHVAAPFSTLLGTLGWTQITKNTAAGTLTAKARARVDRKYVVVGAQQAPNHVVVASVIKNDVRQSGFTSPLPTSFTIDGNAPPFAGPSYVLSNLTVTDGIADLEFTIGGLVTGDKVVLNVEGVGQADPALYDPLAPNFSTSVSLPFALWSLPDTPPAARSVELVY